MVKLANQITDERAKLLPRITSFFFQRPRSTALIWLILLVFGIVSYTSLMRREGFPSVAIPIVIVNGSYAVNDPAELDRVLGKPISDIALKQADVASVSSTSEANFTTVTIQYNEGADPASAKAALQKAVTANGQIPPAAKLSFAAPYFGVTGGSIDKIDATIAVYGNDRTSVQQLTENAKKAVAYLNAHKAAPVDRYFVEDPFQTITNPATGQPVTLQTSFDRFGKRESDVTSFYPAVTIGVASTKDADVIKLDSQIQKDLAGLSRQAQFKDVRTAITASYAPAIKQNISELQKVLLEGLLAVLIVGSIVIAIRASLITVISMVTVIAITIGVIYLLGYTLNVITLFALILGLSLIVDDTIIMVEAIDSARRHNTDRAAVVREAAQKIGRAMIAATLTATLSFMPLAFVGGVLGSFIRAIPVTIISALITSLFVALIFIPLFARYLMLGKRQLGKGSDHDAAARLESKIAHAVARPMLWARYSRAKEFAVGISAVLIGLAFIVGGGLIFTHVPFNIFPPSKDSNQLSVDITFQADTTVAQANQIASQVENVVEGVTGSNLKQASYYGMGNNRSATLYLELTPYDKREQTAPQMADAINAKLRNFETARVVARPVDVGPPSSNFVVDIRADNRVAAEATAKDMVAYLKALKLVRPSGEVARITSAEIRNASVYYRQDGRQVISVSAAFDGTDTSTLTTLAQRAVNDRYTPERLRNLRLQAGDVTFNIGQESENQESFKSLLIAFPLVLLAIYILLLIQFRSFLQPLLIFMALPFSFFGIALGLYLTDNSFSFFAMLGFFALIGLSIKNTILLTDYANQARRAGLRPVEAVVAALGERFRPLIATSLTAVFSLIPLAITSPFWQSLAVVLIFGLISSTLLVILVFPYYYLGAEYIRLRIAKLRHRKVS